jgi:hypothetical protein
MYLFSYGTPLKRMGANNCFREGSRDVMKISAVSMGPQDPPAVSLKPLDPPAVSLKPLDPIPRFQ